MKTKLTRQLGALALLALATLNSQVSTAHAQGTAFTYQGRLNSGGGPASGLYDFRFKLYADPLGNTQVGSSYATNAIPVTNGLFTTTIDFGAGIFTGGTNWLEVDVRTNNAPSYTASYTVLNPFQQVTPTPNAIFAETAGNVSGAVAATQISGAVANGNLPSSPTVSGTVTAGAFTGNGANVTNVNAAALNGLNATNFWQTGGNNVVAGQFLGSTNNQPVEIWANNQRVLRFAYATNSTDGSLPNVLAGYAGNYISNGVVGATISGGGSFSNQITYPADGGIETVTEISGGTNSVSADFGTVLGGIGNVASGFGACAMGAFSTASGSFSFAMGKASSASSNNSTAFGSSAASGAYSTALGSSAASGAYSTAMGGSFASGADSTALGGGSTASGNSSTAMGDGTTASGNSSTAMGEATTASGNYSTAMGDGTTASGDYSFAAGFRAVAAHNGTFVWADDSSYPEYFYSTAPNQFLIRAQGGVGINKNNPATALDVNGTVTATTFVGGNIGLGMTPAWAVDVMASQAVVRLTTTNNSNGADIELRNTTLGLSTTLGAINFNDGSSSYPGQIAYISSGSTSAMNFRVGGVNRMTLNSSGLTVNGTFVSSSDRNVKQNFQPVDSRSVLEKVSQLPVQTWAYKNDPGTKHLGPMAQDFYAAFGTGADDKHIAVVDEGGVALAAIQGLNQKVEEQRAENTELKQQLAELKALVEKLASTPAK